MTDQQRAAMQAALEALEDHRVFVVSRERVKHPEGTELYDEQIAQLRAALSEPEVERAEIGPEWTPCVKRPVTVHVRGQRPGEAHVSTREGLTPVKPDDLIMRGVDGEEYPIGRDLFNRTYFVGVARIKQVAGQEAALAEQEATTCSKCQGTGSIYMGCDSWVHCEACNATGKVHGALPHREWQSLTDEEREQFVQWMHPDVLERVEAALKEKNK